MRQTARRNEDVNRALQADLETLVANANARKARRNIAMRQSLLETAYGATARTITVVRIDGARETWTRRFDGRLSLVSISDDASLALLCDEAAE